MMGTASAAIEDRSRAEAQSQAALRAALEAIFDRSGYQRLRPDLAATGMDPLDHYLAHGWRESLPGHPLLDSGYYGRWNPDSRDVPPMLHYVTSGEARGVWPNAAFDPQHYARAAGLSGPQGALAHYLARGAAKRLPTHSLIGALPAPERGLPAWSALACRLRDAGESGCALYDLAGCAPRAAAVAHVFYPDLWPELATRLRLLPPTCEVFVTFPHTDGALAERLARDMPSARLRPCADRGRDIGPFMSVLPELLAGGYRCICKVHTKRGATEPDAWRFMMLEALLPDQATIGALIAAFEAAPDLAAIGPMPFHLDGERFIGDNAERVRELASQALGRTPIPAQWGFFAGSMFWIRPDILRPLAGLALDFGEDNLANDGRAAHAVERLFGLLSSASGGRIGVLLREGDRTRVDDLALHDAPGILVQDELADTLPGAARLLAVPLRKLTVARRREWRAPADTPLGVTLVGPVEAQHGLGVSARGYARALMATGLPLHVKPWRAGFERVRHLPTSLPSGADQPINLLHLNLDLLQTASLLDSPPLNQICNGRFNVAIVSWELMTTRPEWDEVLRRLDEIWVGSEFTRRALAAVTATPVRVLRPTISVDPKPSSALRRSLGVEEGRKVFVYGADLGSLSIRKNPEAFWEAYAATFAPGDGAACVLKLHYADHAGEAVTALRALAEERKDMVLLTRSLSDADMQALFAMTDVYVSPHRSEGVGLTVVEAMLAGKPVVATRFGGVEDFVDDTTAFVTRHRLIEVGPGADPYPPGAIWADPDVEDLGDQMRLAVTDAEGAAKRAAAARSRVEGLFGPKATTAAMDEALRKIWRAGGGEA